MQILQGQKDTYIIIKEIAKGVGAFGRIYMVQRQHDTTGKVLALKTIDLYNLEKEWGKDYELRKRTEREYIAGLINHPNIVRNHDWGYTDEGKHTYFFVMDFYPDGNLLQRINQKFALKQKYSIDEINKIAGQILSGLKSLHSQGIVHRDLKCENILCDGERLALADFGLCGFVASRITRGAIGGTPGYMPSQQKESDKKNALQLESMDIYAFGVIFYLLFTFHFPFGDHEDTSTYYKRQKNDQWDDISKYRPDVPDLWKQIIERCLRDNIKERFKSVDEINQLLNVIPVEPQVKIKSEKTEPVKSGLCNATDEVLLQILYGGNTPVVFNLGDIAQKKNSNVLLVGRNDYGVQNDINISDTDMFISRRHATIERNEERNCYYLIDGQFAGGCFINSKNGTALNGEILEKGKRYLLHFNDVIIVGETNIRISGAPLQNTEIISDNSNKELNIMQENHKEIIDLSNQAADSDTSEDRKHFKLFNFKFYIDKNKTRKTT